MRKSIEATDLVDIEFEVGSRTSKKGHWEFYIRTTDPDLSIITF